MKKETAKAIYNEVPDWMKKVLVDEFGEKTFAKKEYTDIKTIEDVQSVCPFDIPDGLEPDLVAYLKLKAIVKAINQGWVPDWTNTNQPKYWPYFNLSSSFSFSSSSYGFVCADTAVGSRLCFETEEKCKYAATTFLSNYEEFITIKK
jgi:hypothetical protein